MTMQLFRVEFHHSTDDDRPGITHKQPDVRFIVAPEEYYVTAYCANIKWLWGEHPYEVQSLGTIDKIITVEDQP